MLMAHGWRVGCLGKEQAQAWTINVLHLACDSEFVFFPWGFILYYVPGLISCVFHCFPCFSWFFIYCICFILMSCIAFYFKSLADGSSLDITCVKLSCVVFSFVFHLLVITCYSRVFKFTLKLYNRATTSTSVSTPDNCYSKLLI